MAKADQKILDFIAERTEADAHKKTYLCTIANKIPSELENYEIAMAFERGTRKTVSKDDFSHIVKNFPDDGRDVTLASIRPLVPSLGFPDSTKSWHSLV